MWCWACPSCSWLLVHPRGRTVARAGMRPARSDLEGGPAEAGCDEHRGANGGLVGPRVRGHGEPTRADVRAVGKSSMGTRSPALTPGPLPGCSWRWRRWSGAPSAPACWSPCGPTGPNPPSPVRDHRAAPGAGPGRRPARARRPAAAARGQARDHGRPSRGRRTSLWGTSTHRTGSGAAARVRGLAGGAPVIALSLDGTARTAALAAGARGFVEKDGAADSWSPPCTPSHPTGARDDDHAAAAGRHREPGPGPGRWGDSHWEVSEGRLATYTHASSADRRSGA